MAHISASDDHNQKPAVRKRRKLTSIAEEQNGYTLSKEDISVLNRWRMLLNNRKTREVYTTYVLKVCDFYKLPLHEITPDLWIRYMNTIISDKIVKREISVSTSRICYYAVTGFLSFYGAEHPEFKDISDKILNPASAPTPKANRYPTAMQMATILQTVKETDSQVYLAMLLAYECALTPGEVVNLKTTSFKNEDGKYLLEISGSSERLLIIRSDLMKEVESFFTQSGYFGDDWLFHNQGGLHLSSRDLQRNCRKAQQPLIDSGILLEPYTIMSIRSASLQRMFLSDGADNSSIAQYAGISERYTMQMKKASLSSAVQLPGTRHGYNISNLLDKQNRLDADTFADMSPKKGGCKD